MQTTPTNMWKLVANHQIKFIHGRSHAELEVDVNKWLTTNLGKYEIKEIKLDFSQSGAWLAMIHYYEHVRTEQVTNKIAEKKANPPQASAWTRHIAPSQNTPMSHNTKQTTTVIQPDLNSINNALDKLKPGDTTPVIQPEQTQVVEPVAEPTPEPIPEPTPLVKPDTRGDLTQDEIDGK